MTISSDPWGNRSARTSHGFQVRDQVLSRRRARRMSRRFAGVGVGISATRLQEIAAGAPFVPDELMDFNFALAATGIEQEVRLAKSKRRRRQVIHWLIVTGMVLAALNLLLCMTYLFVILALHEAPW